MGFLDEVKKQADELKDRASEFVGQHGEKITEGIDKVASKLDTSTQGKYSDRIQSGTARAKEAVHRFGDSDGENDRKDDTPPA